MLAGGLASRTLDRSLSQVAADLLPEAGDLGAVDRGEGR